MRGAHFSARDEAALISSETLHEEASRAVQNQIPQEDLPFELLLPVEKDQEQENGKSADRFKDLSRVRGMFREARDFGWVNTRPHDEPVGRP